jgi:hypothetical protein
MHQPWPVLTFGPCVVKPLGITVKKAVEKFETEKLNNMYYGREMKCSNEPAMLLGITLKKAVEKCRNILTNQT